MTNQYSVLGYTHFEYQIEDKVDNEHSGRHPYGITQRIKLLFSKDDKKYTLILIESIGGCPSGYCSASWGEIESFAEEEFVPDFIPKTELSITLPNNLINNMFDEIYKMSNTVFEYSYNCNDEWYPAGYISIAKELFEPNTDTNKDTIKEQDDDSLIEKEVSLVINI